MRRFAPFLTSTVAAWIAVGLAGCGATTLPAAAPPRESGQSALMSQTTAGKVTCDSSEHLRPFVIEWDATDLSSFEARAATDVVFVRYDKCRLEVLDGCTRDSVRGSLGAYGAVTWTAGVVEKVDIQSEAELAAKLPLGVASLGGRVAGGEKFHMEYFVAGTRKSTRAAIYSGDLEGVAGCRGATHFVYAYNLGAFVLGSLTRAQAEVGATLWGLGSAGASGKNESAVDKRGGVLESCRGTSAHETESCKAPIRLTLREIEAGTNPDQLAAVAPETPDALNLAGKLQAAGERSSEAGERQQAANAKLNAGDGPGCLEELDAADRLATKSTMLSTEPQSYVAMTRARCLMEAGQCEAGKSLLRRSLAATQPNLAAAQLDGSVDAFVGMNCKGKDLEPRDRVLRSLAVLQDGAYQGRIEPARCQAAFDEALAALPAAKPRGPDDNQLTTALRRLMDSGPRCASRGGPTGCAPALKMLRAIAPRVEAQEKHQIYSKGSSLIDAFVNTTRAACLGQTLPGLTPLEAVWRVSEELDLGTSDVDWTVAACRRTVAEGRRAVAALGPLEDADRRQAVRELTENAVECLDKAGDCEGAFRIHADLFPADQSEHRTWRIAQAFDWSRARHCAKKPLPALRGEEQVFWNAALLDRARMEEAPDPAVCRSLLAALRATITQGMEDGGGNALLTSVLGDAAYCFGKAGACTEGWAAERERLLVGARPGSRPPEYAEWARRTPRCKDVAIP